MPVLLQILIRSFFLFFALILILRVLGRRFIRGRTGWERLSGIVLAILFAAVSVNLISLQVGIVAILTWSLLLLLTGLMMERSKLIRDLLVGKEIIVVQHGKVLEDNLKEARMTPEDFLRELRTKKVFRVADVEFAVLESDGEMNLLLKSDLRPLAPIDLGVHTEAATAPQTVLLDGKVLDEGLGNLGLSRDWLQTELEKIGILPENVLIGQVDSSGDLYVDLFDDAIRIPSPSTRRLMKAQLESVEADLMTYELETKDRKAKDLYKRAQEEIKTILKEMEPYLK